MALISWIHNVWQSLDKSYDNWQQENIQFMDEHPELTVAQCNYTRQRWPW